MEKERISKDKKLFFSGVPVVCHDCSRELFKGTNEKCTSCGAYLCPDCKKTHVHNN